MSYWLRQVPVEDHPGLRLPELRVTLDPVDLFRFAAVTWNAHRIHYDGAYAAAEGYPRPIAAMHLVGSLMLQLAQRWAGPAWAVGGYRYRVLQPAAAGDVLIVAGEVAGRPTPGSLDLHLSVGTAHGPRVAAGAASMIRPVA